MFSVKYDLTSATSPKFLYLLLPEKLRFFLFCKYFLPATTPSCVKGIKSYSFLSFFMICDLFARAELLFQKHEVQSGQSEVDVLGGVWESYSTSAEERA